MVEPLPEAPLSADRPGAPEHCTVAVIGGGPAGLAAATELARLGVRGVVVLEREAQAGGIPRHCGHSPFGFREFGRCYLGPRYAARLVERARHAGVEVRVNTTVVAAGPGGRLTLATARGAARLHAGRVALCTGARETPRAARLVSGQRPLGVLTTGALQAMVYLKREIPFARPLIVGTELVSLSALLTCRHAGIRPVAMLEAGGRFTAWRGAGGLPKLLGAPVYLQTRIAELIGAQRLSGVRVIDAAGTTRQLRCDGVLFTGQFTPESALLQSGHIAVDRHSGGPVIDQFGRCSDPAYFAAGTALRAVEPAGWCWREGVQVARCVHRDLAGQLPGGARLPVTFADPAIKYIVPQTISLTKHGACPGGLVRWQLRFLQVVRGRLSLHSDAAPIQSKTVRARPERRVLLALDARQLAANPPRALRMEFAPG